MQELVKSMLKRVLPRKIYHPFRQASYSQDGEDRILARVFEEADSGFFVDVGAHHPWRFSNTYLFYERGWRGINIDATPNSMKQFRRHRSRDINLEMGIAQAAGVLSMYLFDEPALNTFDTTRAGFLTCTGTACLREVRAVSVAPLSMILREHCPAGTEISFLSVDVEGYDLEVLRSNDWNAYRPAIVVVEDQSDLGELQKGELVRYLGSEGYALFAKTMTSAFLRNVA
jgi:FkbM family methyltransferase